MSQRSEVLQKYAETYVEKVLMWIITLPTPFSAVAVLVWSLVCIALGWLL